MTVGYEGVAGVRTCCCWPTRYDSNQCRAVPLIPNVSRRRSRIAWSSVSKAADRSKTTSAAKLPESIASRMSDRTYRTSYRSSVETFEKIVVFVTNFGDRKTDRQTDRQTNDEQMDSSVKPQARYRERRLFKRLARRPHSHFVHMH